jgi:signal transduction histidine kinase
VACGIAGPRGGIALIISTRWFRSSLVIALHAVAILLYLLHGKEAAGQDIWVNWSTQASALVGVSAVLFGLGTIVRTPSIQIAFSLGELSLFFLGVYGEAGFSVALFAWGAALVIGFFSSLTFRTALILSLGMVLGIAFLPRATSLWGVSIGNRDPGDAFEEIVFYALVIYLAASIRRTSDVEEETSRAHGQLQDALLRLTSANVGFQNYAVEAQQRGTEEERLRITREIHDLVGYTLTSFMMMTKASEELIDRDHETLRRLLGEAREQCQEALVETRRTLRELRAIRVPDVDFSKQVWKTVHTFELATGIRTQLQFRNIRQVRSPEIRTVLHRLVQEGLTNAFRHGRASEVSVLFWDDGKGISVVVRDNGLGSAAFQEDIGIRGMRERFEPLGGTVQAASIAGGGFEVRGWVPVPRDGEVEG